MTALCNDVLRHILTHVARRVPDYLWTRVLHVLLPPSHRAGEPAGNDDDMTTLCHSIQRPLFFIVNIPARKDCNQICLPFDCSSNVSLVVDWGDHSTSRRDMKANITRGKSVTLKRLRLRRISHAYSPTRPFQRVAVRVYRRNCQRSHRTSSSSCSVANRPATRSTIHFGYFSDHDEDWDDDGAQHRICRMISLGNIGVHSLEGLFLRYVKNVKFEPSFDVSNVTNMSYMFHNAFWFNDHNVRYWNVCNVTNMSHMFDAALEFNVDIGQWNVANVKNMSRMFAHTSDFNQPIGDWNVSSVKDMSYMFERARTFDQPIGHWDVSNVIDMSGMFCETHAFNQHIGQWNVGNVKYMGYMFADARTFNQPIAQWNTDKVKEMQCMFYDARAFKQPFANWNGKSVKNNKYMFHGAGQGKPEDVMRSAQAQRRPECNYNCV